ncbi:methyl-accepting chemotaxis protein [Rhizobium alvei]|uniref:Methyl-accepting chemotaxis protein n=1 Tax=Rhizobium alvei TaxID=1132659 RepID=A0ABT8YGM9_9HYPH|nr:methyl-accepting chemotaxis protein [Rhizobium alvei]MDO6962736.1 methyl-accepting chemotaxis protein [Rhizobium alvei]
MKNLTVSQKIFLLAAMAITIMASAMVYRTFEATEAIVAERKTMLVGMNDVAVSILEQYHKQEVAGTMTREAAQKAAITEVMALRYGKEGYFWINDLDGIMVAHAMKPAMNGKSQLDLKDPNGVYIFREMIKVARESGEGYVDYWWPKPGNEDPVQKYSHIKAYAPWNYIVGNGVYGDDIAAIQRQAMIQTGLIILFAVIANIGCAFGIGRSISLPLNRLKDVMARVAHNDTSEAVPHVDRGDEIGKIAGALVLLRNSMIERQELERNKDAQQAAIDESRRRTEDVTRASHEKQQAVVARFAKAFEQLSGGDLTVRIDELPGEYRKLGDDFNMAIGNLSETMARISSSTGTLTRSIDEINVAVGQLSTRTESQAANLEETAAAIAEISKTVRDSDTNIKTARTMASEAKTDAATSGGIVNQAIEAMGRIENSSSRIGEIIGVIDEIAFQTNLLALNAGVEAARAGEAGKGFAVVAQEVRELAQRSATAAREIKALINESSSQVGAGVELVEATGKALSGIDHHVIGINDAILRVAALAQEQSAGISEINTAINQIDQMTQHNAAMVEETTAATMTLAAEAQSLQELLAAFRIGMPSQQQAHRRVA